MGGKYLPVPAQDPYNGNANINTPANLRAWMRSHYQRETVGNRQSTLQKLTQEKFLPSDSPDTYEKRIRPLLLGVADNDLQTIGFLKNHLSGDLYTWMRGVGPLTITAFFTNLKDMWLERNPCVSAQIPIVSQPIQPILTPQNDTLAEGNKALKLVKRLTKDLDYSGIATDVDTIGIFIYDELGRRLGRKTDHNRRSPFSELQVRNTNATKKVKRVIQKVPARQIVIQQVVRH